MSLIFEKKRVFFLPKCSQFGKKGPSKTQRKSVFVEKGSFLSVLSPEE